GHGRVNLIGDHTDYNLGLALPMTLPLHVTVDAQLRSDWQVAVRSGAFPEDGLVQFEVGAWRCEGRWTDYVRGASALLAREGIFEHGAAIAIQSDIPPGAGLASSAALCVALVQALSRLGGVTLDALRIARLARAIETDFVGAPVGMMDQIAAQGAPGRAQMIDFRDESSRPVSLPASLDVDVIDSGIAHEHRSSGYADRRRECAEACALLGVASLRDVGDDASAAAHLPDPLPRRVRHVVSENQRVRDAVTALQRGEVAAFGALMSASHASLRDDFDVSLPEIDAIVDQASHSPGVLGARLTGGGFGGSVVIAKQLREPPAISPARPAPP
ncbi:MAG: galactokinase family protein, partial [Vicinamibacterales bacterium]